MGKKGKGGKCQMALDIGQDFCKFEQSGKLGHFKAKKMINLEIQIRLTLQISAEF